MHIYYTTRKLVSKLNKNKQQSLNFLGWFGCIDLDHFSVDLDNNLLKSIDYCPNQQKSDPNQCNQINKKIEFSSSVI